ncbi:MAG: glycosyltransferase family 4 protein, partial [Caldilineaceae bacterium]|nr:glycosyltransferase family 4 protein [Caldilineaceae bacterium]
VVAGNRDATPEVVVDGETGLLIDPTSSDQFANAADRLLSDPQLCQRMGLAGRERVATHFTFDHFAHTLLGYIDELAG